MFPDGTILAMYLYPDNAGEIQKIAMRGELMKLVLVGGIVVIAVVFQLLGYLPPPH